MDSYENVIIGCLQEIRSELDRCYWNKHQTEMNSPFENTGEKYKNNTFSVSAYSWSDEDDEPNFQYKGLSCFWYKHCKRGFSYNCIDELTLEYLEMMIRECKESIRKDFGER